MKREKYAKMSLRPLPDKTKNENVAKPKPVDLFPISKLSDRLSAVLAIGMQRRIRGDSGASPLNDGSTYNDFGNFDNDPFPDIYEAQMSKRVKIVYLEIVQNVSNDPVNFVFTSLGKDRAGNVYPLLERGYQRIPDAMEADKRSYWVKALATLFKDFTEDTEDTTFFFERNEEADPMETAESETIQKLTNVTNKFNLSSDFDDFIGLQKQESVEFFSKRMILTGLAVRRGLSLPMIAAYHNHKFVTGKILSFSTLIFGSTPDDLFTIVKDAIEVKDKNLSEQEQSRVRSNELVNIAKAMFGLLDRLRRSGFWLTSGFDINSIRVSTGGDYRLGLTNYRLYLFDFNPATSRVWDGSNRDGSNIGDCGMLFHAALLIAELFQNFQRYSRELTDYFLSELRVNMVERDCIKALEHLRDHLFREEINYHRANFMKNFAENIKATVYQVFPRQEGDMLYRVSKFLTEQLDLRRIEYSRAVKKYSYERRYPQLRN